MKHVPKYLLPKNSSVNPNADSAVPLPAEGSGGDADKPTGTGFVPFRKMSSMRGRGRGRARGGGRGGGSGKKKSDPLKKFGR
jgi:ATP-dependent RNA helicase DDX56/DBP9